MNPVSSFWYYLIIGDNDDACADFGGLFGDRLYEFFAVVILLALGDGLADHLPGVGIRSCFGDDRRGGIGWERLALIRCGDAGASAEQKDKSGGQKIFHII